MFEKWRGISQKWLIVFAIIGVLLLILGNCVDVSQKSEETLDVRMRAYTEQLEEKIEKMLNALDGVGDVHVLLTLDGSSAFLYATNQNVNGGKDHVILENGDTQSPLLMQEVFSDIRGISVVCKNGDDPEIKRKIIGVLCTGLGVPSNRVFVAGH